MAYTQADLDIASRHIFEAERHIVRQEAIVTQLRVKGADTALAEDLLAEFQSTLRMHRDDRDMIAHELGQ
jgi:hypothetical protein